MSDLKLISLLNPFPSIFLLLESILSKRIERFSFTKYAERVRAIAKCSCDPSIVSFMAIT